MGQTGQFLDGQPQLKPLPMAKQPWWHIWPQARMFELLAAWSYMTASGRVITVPAGFVTDGASIPWVLWVFLQPTGSLFNAAILHDFIYSDIARLDKRYADIDRATADAIFREAALSDGASLATAASAHAAVAAAGWLYWEKSEA